MKNKLILLLMFMVILNIFFTNVTYAFESDSESNSGWKGVLDKFSEVFDRLKEIFNSVKNIDQEFKNFMSNLVQYISDGLIEFFISLGDTVLEMIVDPLAAAVPNFLLETVEIDSIPIVNTIWKACYVIGLVILTILTALGLGLGGNEAFRYDNFGLPEHIIVRMFFTLGLMTASKTIAIHIYNIVGWMTKYIYNDVALAISTKWDVTGEIGGLLRLALFAIFLIFALLLNILIFVILIIRILDLLVLTALSPISASTFVLPNTKFIAINHLKEYIAVVLVQFILIVFLALWTGLATMTDGLILKFTGDFAMQGLAKVVGQGVMMIVLMVYTISRPAWLKRLLGVGSASSIGGLLMLARMI